jgi:hypothetical protein
MMMMKMIIRRRRRRRRRNNNSRSNNNNNTVTSQDIVMFRVTAVKTSNFICTILNFFSFSRNSVVLCSRILLSAFPFSIFLSPVRTHQFNIFLYSWKQFSLP